MNAIGHLARGLLAGLLAASCCAAIAQGEVAAKGGALDTSLPQSTPPARVGAPVQSSLPDLGSSANAGLSRADEYQIGRQIMADLYRTNQVLDDPETTDYLQSLGSRIGAEAQDGEHKLTFFVIRDPSINAFALPGGFIGTHTGLITRTNAESELGGVLAHEIGHVVQRHIARALQADARSSIATIAGMLGAIIVGAATGNAEALPGIIALGQGTAMQQQINFTRMEEQEADRVGISYLAQAGFDPNGMAAFFATMMRERGLAGDDIPALLLTHPVDTQRLAEARARIASMPPAQRRPESDSYPYIRERIRVLTSTSRGDLRRYYERASELDPGNGSLKYGAALTELEDNNPEAAAALLHPLAAANPHLSLLQSALGQAEFAAGRGNDARGTFERTLTIAPRNVPVSVRYAEVLLQLGDAKKAHELLLDLFNNVPPTPSQIRLIALAASQAGDTGDAYYYMAELYIANGDLPLAMAQLDLALASPGLTEVQRKRFQARRDEIRDFLRYERGDRSSRRPPQG